VYLTNKTDLNNITEILLKVALNTINKTNILALVLTHNILLEGKHANHYTSYTVIKGLHNMHCC
jgi:hypothetical protein